MPSKLVWQNKCWQEVAQGQLSYQYCELGAYPELTQDHLRQSDATSTIIAMHGWLDNSASFTPMLEHLLQQSATPSMQVYALDFAGHGHSFHRPHGCFYTIWDYAIDVVQFIQAKNLKKLVLLGHSMGACVAPLVASMLPHQVQAICAIEALGPVATDIEETPRQLHKAILRQTQQAQRKSKVFASPKAALAARLGAKMSLQESAARLLVERNLVANEDAGGGFVWRSDRRVTLPSPMRFSEEQVRAVLASLEVPVTLVVGDDLQTNDNLAQRAERVAKLQWLRLSGTHHLHMENQVSACSQALVDLCTECLNKEA